MPINDSNVLNCAMMLNPVEVKMPKGAPMELHRLGAYAGYLFMHQQTLKSTYPVLWYLAETALDAAVNEPSDPAKANKAWLACYNLLAEGKLLAE
jgi:hypothetical protein